RLFDENASFLAKCPETAIKSNASREILRSPRRTQDDSDETMSPEIRHPRAESRVRCGGRGHHNSENNFCCELCVSLHHRITFTQADENAIPCGALFSPLTFRMFETVPVLGSISNNSCPAAPMALPINVPSGANVRSPGTPTF